MDEKQIEVAVAWWSGKLRGCKNSGLSQEERRDRTNDGYQLAAMLMTASRPKVSEEQILVFSASLTAQLKDKQEQYLSVDYGPDLILGNALAAAGIDGGMGTLPIKTSMWLDDGQVSVRYGYGAEAETIYPAKR